MFAELTGPADPPIPRLKDTTNPLEIARQHYNVNDLKSAAVYVRAVFEAKLRKTCERNHIPFDFKEDVKKVTAQMLWDRVLARHRDMLAVGKEFLDPNLIPGLNAVRSQVLNSLSHDGGAGLTGPDVDAAINIMTAFRASTIPHKP